MRVMLRVEKADRLMFLAAYPSRRALSRAPQDEAGQVFDFIAANTVSPHPEEPCEARRLEGCGPARLNMNDSQSSTRKRRVGSCLTDATRESRFRCPVRMFAAMLKPERVLQQS